jgi:DNA-binding transcriptional ArsR family regulator
MEKFNDVLTAIEAITVEVAARVGPILAPVPTAYAVGNATLTVLGWPMTVSAVAAIVIELLGLAAVNTALMLRDYNAGKRKSDPRAPFGLAAALSAVYLVTAVTLAVLLDVIPSLARFSPAIFPLLSLAGVTVLGLRSDHRKRVEAIAEDKARRRKMRKERREDRKREESQAEADRKLQEAERKLQEARRKEAEAKLVTLGNELETMRYYQENPAATQAEAAETLGYSERTIRNHLKALEDAGAVKRNGQGVEVIVT